MNANNNVRSCPSSGLESDVLREHNDGLPAGWFLTWFNGNKHYKFVSEVMITARDCKLQPGAVGRARWRIVIRKACNATTTGRRGGGHLVGTYQEQHRGDHRQGERFWPHLWADVLYEIESCACSIQQFGDQLCHGVALFYNKMYECSFRELTTALFVRLLRSTLGSWICRLPIWCHAVHGPFSAVSPNLRRQSYTLERNCWCVDYFLTPVAPHLHITWFVISV